MHITKNFLNSVYVLLSKDLLEKLIINKFNKLVIIDIGKSIKNVSIILNFRISKKGVPKTSTPTPIIDWKIIIIQK